MPVGFPWLPIGSAVAGSETGRLLKDGGAYQIVEDRLRQQPILLLREDGCRDPILATLNLSQVDYGTTQFHAASFTREQAPVQVSDLVGRADFQSAGQLLDLARALREMGTRVPDASWNTALYVPGKILCLAMGLEPDDRQLLAVRLLTGGVGDKRLSASQIRQYNPWVTANDIGEFFEIVGVATDQAPPRATRPEAPFALPGRPDVEALFREYIIDFFQRRPEYEAMGIRAPNGVLLYGPPGSGKTHAVRKLAKHLGWPIFEIGMGEIGSPYIHQTSVTLKQVFDEAAGKAPALILMDEVDAVVGQRTLAAHDHKIEEVSELLKLLETAGGRGVLVIATTNRVEAIDPAMLRKGRFDHQIEVGYPKRAEVRCVLEALLAERPTAAAIDIETVAMRLEGRPMSDIAWVVDDAARLAVKSGKTAVDQECVLAAVKKLTER